ncbi:MAG: SdpI family protein [Rhodothermales bacterium]
MTLRDRTRQEWGTWLVLLLPFLFIPYLWGILPDEIPTHWNAAGEADDYSSKAFGLLFLPILNIVLYIGMIYLVKIDPKKQASVDQKPVRALRFITPFFMTAVFGFIIYKTLNPDANVVGMVMAGIGLLFAAIGNYLGTIQPNYFIGIRTPWTLQSDEVWRATHRMAGPIWMAAGLGLAIGVFVFPRSIFPMVFMGVTVLIVLIPLVYSYLAFQQLDDAADVE